MKNLTNLIKSLTFIAIFLLLVGLVGCKSGVGPVPPAEIPTFLNIPSDVSIDISQISAATTSISLPASSASLKAVGAGPLAGSIIIGPRQVEENNEVVRFFLFPLSTFDIPVDVAQTTFEGDGPFDSETPEEIFNFKFDFADFDLDGDGATEGCSGCTCPVGCAADGLTTCEGTVDDLKPICIRVWMDDGRYMAMAMDAMRIDDNPGAGRFRLTSANVEPVSDDILIGMVYDHEEANNKSSDLFAQSSGAADEGGDDVTGMVHALVTEKLTGAGMEKSVFVDSKALFTLIPDQFIQYIGKYIEEADFIGLHVLQDYPIGDPSPVDVSPPACAMISTATEDDLAQCTGLGIDVTGIPFIDSATEADFSMPPVSEFPETPTF